MNRPNADEVKISDMTLLRSLVGVALNSEWGALAGEIGDICRAAFGEADGFFFLGKESDLPGSHGALPEQWRTCVEETLRQDAAVSLPLADAGSLPGMCCPLPLDGAQRGVICVTARTFSEIDAERLRGFADLIAEALNARFAFDRRNRELLETEEQSKRHQQIIDQIHDSVIAMDLEGYITSWNKGAENLFGYTANEVIGKNILFLYADENEDDSLLYQDLFEKGGREMVVRRRKKSGEDFSASLSLSLTHDRDDNPIGIIGYMMDVTERLQAEEQIYRLAYYDSLTGLPNRAMLYTLLKQALTAAHRSQRHGAVLFIDLDRFKQINDSLGQEAGDLLLKEVSRRLTECVRNEDVAARIGGDEFVVALFDITKQEHAAIVAKKILDSLSLPIMVNGHDLLVASSIGISVYPDDGDDAETLIKCADVAMFRAKQGGCDEGYMFFSQDMNQRSLERLQLENNLRRALERNELLLHYQPQLDLVTGKIIGAEVLLRWQHGDTTIPPAQFIPLAEETGLIIPIGEWILETVCAKNKQWQEAGLPIVRLAVNISARQFRPQLPQLVQQVLNRHGLDASYLELEITESVIMQNAEGVIALMQDFQRLGIALSLDDFGTGYSSLSYLKRFPIDTLKIDQSFVRGLPDDTDDTAIAKAIISLARNLGIRVIAEGVENLAQMDFLRAADCDEIQGYYYSRPLPEEDFVRFLQQ